MGKTFLYLVSGRWIQDLGSYSHFHVKDGIQEGFSNALKVFKKMSERGLGFLVEYLGLSLSLWEEIANI